MLTVHELYHYWKYLTCYARFYVLLSTLKKHALDKNIGACTDNHAASTYARNSKDIASKALLYKIYFMLNGKIDVGK